MRMGCNTSPNVPSEPASPERVGGSHLAQEHQAEAAVPAKGHGGLPARGVVLGTCTHPSAHSRGAGVGRTCSTPLLRAWGQPRPFPWTCHGSGGGSEQGRGR